MRVDAHHCWSWHPWRSAFAAAGRSACAAAGVLACPPPPVQVCRQSDAECCATETAFLRGIWRCASTAIRGHRGAARTFRIAGPVGSHCVGRRVLQRRRVIRSGASREVLSPSAFAGLAALPGAAGTRTIPLRPWLALAGHHCDARSRRRPLRFSASAADVGSHDPLPYAAAAARRDSAASFGRDDRSGSWRRKARPGRGGSPTALLGFGPSQLCSCPRASGCFHPSGPTCR